MVSSAIGLGARMANEQCSTSTIEKLASVDLSRGLIQRHMANPALTYNNLQIKGIIVALRNVVVCRACETQDNLSLGFVQDGLVELLRKYVCHAVQHTGGRQPQPRSIRRRCHQLLAVMNHLSLLIVVRSVQVITGRVVWRGIAVHHSTSHPGQASRSSLQAWLLSLLM